MKLQYLSSACVILEDEGVKVLCDPWLVDGAYLGSWFHYPPLKFKPEDFSDVDYIYISHIHPDHIDPNTLKRMDKNIPVIINNYNSKFLKKNIENLGFSVTEFNHNERVHLKKNLFMKILAADNCNLEVFEIEINEINGGSIRTYIKHKDCKKFSKSKKISEILDKERKMGLDEIEPYHQFAERIKELKKKTYDFIKDEVSKGKTIYIYGASTRGNTLLQFYNLDHRLIKAAADRNPMKWGKEIVGAGIPIISEEQARKEKPDYFLVLPWYFIDEFKKRESDYLKNGGKFIVPLPEFQII